MNVANELAKNLLRDKNPHALLSILAKRKANSEGISSSVTIVSHITILRYFRENVQRRTVYRMPRCIFYDLLEETLLTSRILNARE